MLRMTYKDDTTSYDVEVSAIKSNVIAILSTTIIPVKEVGFTLNNGEEVFDYTSYNTLYRQQDGSIQYSNDGEIWVEPTKTVIVQAFWQDNEDELEKRPDGVKVSVLDNEQVISKITLKPKTDWVHEYKNVPVSHVYSIVPEDVEGYIKEVENTVVTYSINEPYEPSLDIQVAELTDTVIELDERVYALEEEG